MSNPTTGNQSQFSKPFNILPDVIYTNPTLEYTNGGIFDPFITSIRPRPNTNPLQNVVTAEQLAQNNDSNQWEQSSQADFTPELNKKYANWQAKEPSNTNITLASITSRLIGIGAARLGGFTGVPQVAQGIQNLLSSGPPLSGLYSTLPIDELHAPLNINTTIAPGLGINTGGVADPAGIRLQGSPIKYGDFRSRLAYIPLQDGQLSLSSRLNKIQLNGASAGLLGSVSAIAYAGASATPAGPYSIFNLESWFGWGEHDNPDAIRTDFTAKSHVTTRWINNKWQKVGLNSSAIGRTTALTEVALPFRGDKINVIDFLH